ncbi:MAG: cytochrome c maturation protein CcmE [Nitrospinota bacterium]|nr:cytochrome c maturation protein CcmE [Nitrospinota bacterium]
MKNSGKKFLIASLVVVGAIGYLVYAGIKETSVYYLTVSEALASSEMKSGNEFRMEGHVEAGTINIAADNLGAKFQIKDDKNSIPVSYRGTIPDMFSDDIDVVVQGYFDVKEGVFKAHTLLTSCPSKYEASEMEKES